MELRETGKFFLRYLGRRGREGGGGGRDLLKKNGIASDGIDRGVY